LLGANAIVLPPSVGFSPRNIRQLVSVISNDPADTQPALFPVNLSLIYEEVPRAVWLATRRFLGGGLFCFTLACWAGLGRKQRSPFLRWLLGCGWGLSGLLLCLLLTVPRGYLEADNVLLPGLWGLLITAFLSGVLALRANYAEVRCAWQQGRAWAQRLERSELRFWLSGGDETPPIKGSSLGVKLFFSFLRASLAAHPVTAEQSWFWRQLSDQLSKKLPHWAGTGELTAWGWIKQVKRVPEKIASADAHPAITDLITPVQLEAFPVLWQRLSAMETSDGKVAEAASAARLRLHRYPHIVLAVLALSGLMGWRSIAGGLALSVILAAASSLAWDLYSLNAPCEVFGPQIFRPLNSTDDRQLQLKIKTTIPATLQIRVVSSYYHNREGKLREYPGTEFADAVIELNKKAGGTGEPTIDIEVRQQRQLLWTINLTDKIIYSEGGMRVP
jgi:hypothetical protein